MQKTLAKGHRNDASRNPKDQVTNQFGRIDEMIRGYMKNGVVAENGTFYDDRCDGGHNRRTQQGRVHVSDDLFEGKDYRGLPQIKQWNEATNAKYHTQMEAIELTANGQETILTVLMSGTFDGSPLPAKFCFIISDDKIKSLVVR